MKIILPKTLAEPGTIPWPTIIEEYKTGMAIIQAIQNFFRNAESNDEVPTNDFEAWGESQYSVAEITDIIELIAIKMGAQTAIARCQSKVMRGSTHLGLMYYITFTVPSHKSTEYYRTYINYWFDSKRQTTFR